MARAKTGRLRRVSSRVSAIALLILQGVVLDYYLMREKEPAWYAWVITDIFVLATWVCALVFSYRNTRNFKKQGEKGSVNDELAYAYVLWIVYALHLVPQIAVIMKLVGHTLEHTMIFGPNMLVLVLCVSPILFLFLVYSHHDTKPNSRRKFYFEKLVGTVTLDLFDSVEMLNYVFESHKISPAVENCILTFSCINFFLPTLALYELKHNKFLESGEVSLISFKFIYICVFLLFVNVPFLVLRLFIWHNLKLEVSVLLAKNVLGIILGVMDIAEFVADQRPRKCKNCQKAFSKARYKSHVQECGMNDVEMENLNEPDKTTVETSKEETTESI